MTGSVLVLSDAIVARGAFSLRVSLSLPLDGVSVVFGPSGAGKSILLSAIAGLVRLRSGSMTIGGRVLESSAGRTPPHRRDIGLVFQDARLFPHLTVRGNLHYARRRTPQDRPTPDIGTIAAQTEIADLLDRPVCNLSGGEKGRVALARALVSAPSLLLLDEPFAALDGRRRRSFLGLLRRVHESQALPMVVVTHQIDDVAELADQVVGLRAGEIVASGPAKQVMGGQTFRSLLDARDIGVRVDASAVPGARRSGGVWVRADNVLVASEAPRGLSARHVWAGRVTAVSPEDGGSAVVELDTEVGPVLARITNDAVEELKLKKGASAWAVVKTHAL